jgi:hypothetical protein
MKIFDVPIKIHTWIKIASTGKVGHGSVIFLIEFHSLTSFDDRTGSDMKDEG